MNTELYMQSLEEELSHAYDLLSDADALGNQLLKRIDDLEGKVAELEDQLFRLTGEVVIEPRG